MLLTPDGGVRLICRISCRLDAVIGTPLTLRPLVEIRPRPDTPVDFPLRQERSLLGLRCEM